MAEEVFAPQIPTELTFNDALKKVSKIARSENKVRVGCTEVGKTLFKEQCQLVLLAKGCPKANKDILVALAKQKNVPLIEIEDVLLADCAGLLKVNLNSKNCHPKVAVACITDFVRNSVELSLIKKELN